MVEKAELLDFEDVEKRPVVRINPPVPFITRVQKDPSPSGLLPNTTEALCAIDFLNEYLAEPFSTIRFSKSDINIVHQRNPEILSACKGWVSSVAIVEISGMNSLVDPVHKFFSAGYALVWIEVMATARQLHAISELMKDLQIWTTRVTTVGQFPDC